MAEVVLLDSYRNTPTVLRPAPTSAWAALRAQINEMSRDANAAEQIEKLRRGANPEARARLSVAPAPSLSSEGSGARAAEGPRR